VEKPHFMKKEAGKRIPRGINIHLAPDLLIRKPDTAISRQVPKIPIM